MSPYSDPVCHPSGKIIGFNHTPIKEIKYSYGYDCPRQATYVYDLEKRGFWLMDSNGCNQRRVLPYYLNTPSWSSDGKWILFSNGGIYKMPFNGECFDTNSIVRLTTSTNDYCPQWSPHSIYIAYENSDCGSIVSPIPPNSCGVLLMGPDGNNKTFINRGIFPYWGRGEDTIYYMMYYYDLINKKEVLIRDNIKDGFSITNQPSFNSSKNKIFFSGRFENIAGPVKLYSVNPDGNNFNTVTNDPILDFSFTPDGKIIFLLFDNRRISNETGAFWIMDEDGSNKHQLTFNDFIISYQ